MDMMVNYLTTGIGSLPFSLPHEAVEFSLAHDIPFLPQLPHIEGDMVEQVSNQLPIEKAYSCLDLFLEKTKNHKKIKIQMTGPSTLKKYALSSFSKDTYQKKVLFLLEKFSSFKGTLLYIIDEPFLDLNNPDFFELIQSFTKLNLEIGLHCCHENIDWKRILNLNFKYISFDSHLPHNIPQEALRKYFSQGNYLIVGIDKNRPKNRSLLKSLGEYPSNQTLLSSSCGLATKSSEDCHAALNFLEFIQSSPKHLFA